MAAYEPAGLYCRLYRRYYRLLGLALGTFTGFLFTCSFIAVQLIYNDDADITSLHVSLLRYGFQFVLAIAVMSHKRIHPFGKAYGFHLFFIALGVTNVLNTVFSYEALNRIHVSDFTAILLIRPVLTFFLCFLVAREHCNWMEISCGVLSCIGVMFACRPRFLFRGSSDVEQAVNSTMSVAVSTLSSSTNSDLEHIEGIGLTLSAAFMSATFYVLTRQIGSVSEDIIFSVFYPSIVGCVTIPFMMWLKSDSFTIHFSPAVWIFIAWASLAAYFALMFMAEALQHENATHCMMIRNLDIVYSASLQYFVIGVAPLLSTLFGAIVVVISSCALTWTRIRRDIVT